MPLTRKLHQGAIMSKYVFFPEPEHRANQPTESAVSTGLLPWFGAKIQSGLGYVSETLRPLFSWNPGRD
jgi:hypothetical protein